MRIRRRRIAIFAVAAIGALAAAGTAFAITNNTSSVNFTFTPNQGGLTKSFKSGRLFLHTHTNFAHPGIKGQGGFTKRVQLFFDSDIKFNTGAAPTCNVSLANTTQAQAMQRCGPSLIGRGAAQAVNPPSGTVKGCVLAFNGKKNGAGQPTIILHSRFPMNTCPVNPSTSTGGAVDAILTGTLKPANKTGYGKMLDVPNIDTQPLALKDFTTAVKKGTYVQARCTASPLRVQAKFTYSGTGQSPDTVNATQPCP
jgi:hypothetical protein